MAMSSGVCRSCEGRGWRLASSRRRVRIGEQAVELVRRACPGLLTTAPADAADGLTGEVPFTGCRAGLLDDIASP